MAETDPVVKRLPSGYWHVRWNQNRWIQWPCDRAPTMADAFGWVTSEMLEQAVQAAKASSERTP